MVKVEALSKLSRLICCEKLAIEQARRHLGELMQMQQYLA